MSGWGHRIPWQGAPEGHHWHRPDEVPSQGHANNPANQGHRPRA